VFISLLQGATVLQLTARTLASRPSVGNRPILLKNSSSATSS